MCSSSGDCRHCPVGLVFDSLRCFIEHLGLRVQGLWALLRVAQVWFSGFSGMNEVLLSRFWCLLGLNFFGRQSDGLKGDLGKCLVCRVVRGLSKVRWCLGQSQLVMVLVGGLGLRLSSFFFVCA